MRDLGYRAQAVAGIRLPLSPGEAVDRLEERDAAAGPQHARELAERRLLVGNVDEHEAGRDDVDGAGDAAEVSRRSSDKPAMLEDPELGCGGSADVEQILRSVGEDHGVGTPLEGAEGRTASHWAH